jgi:hypothetical protein
LSKNHQLLEIVVIEESEEFAFVTPLRTTWSSSHHSTPTIPQLVLPDPRNPHCLRDSLNLALFSFWEVLKAAVHKESPRVFAGDFNLNSD